MLNIKHKIPNYKVQILENKYTTEHFVKTVAFEQLQFEPQQYPSYVTTTMKYESKQKVELK
jgi:hypothetical protein